MIDNNWRAVAKNAGAFEAPRHLIAAKPSATGNVLVTIGGQPAGIYASEQRAADGIGMLQRICVAERSAS